MNGLGISGPGKSLPDDHVALHLAVDRLAGVLRQCGLRVERIHLAPAPAHEQRDHGRRAGLEMRRLRARTGSRPTAAAAQASAPAEPAVLRRQQTLLIQQIGEREPADAAARAEEKFPPVPEIPVASMRHEPSPHVQELVEVQDDVSEGVERLALDQPAPMAISAGVAGRASAIRYAAFDLCRWIARFTLDARGKQRRLATARTDCSTA